VLLGPLTSVKEQVPGHYADALARRGFVTLAFDNRSFGESGGNPRQYEHPGRKIEDARAALSFLEQRPEVAEASLGAVGVCAGAGYMSAVVAEDPRVRAFGAVAGFFHDVEMQRKWMGDRFDAAIANGRASPTSAAPRPRCGWNRRARSTSTTTPRSSSPRPIGSRCTFGGTCRCRARAPAQAH
jgi:fermentation-respiration switch protein FrsA (DUF1100 family)